MSLMSLLNGTGSQSTASYSGVSTAAAKLLAARTATANGATSSSSSSSDSGVSISAAAKAAAAAKADNAKDFTALSKEVRATLDAQYATAKAAGDATSTPDVSGLSGRALAAIALNRTGDFNHSEVAAAKAELRQEARASFAGAVASGNSLSALSAYSQQLVTQYDAMSSEEREARGWTAQLRSGSAAFVKTAAHLSMFDQMSD